MFHKLFQRNRKKSAACIYLDFSVNRISSSLFLSLSLVAAFFSFDSTSQYPISFLPIDLKRNFTEWLDLSESRNKTLCS